MCLAADNYAHAQTVDTRLFLSPPTKSLGTRLGWQLFRLDLCDAYTLSPRLLNNELHTDVAIHSSYEQSILHMIPTVGPVALTTRTCTPKWCASLSSMYWDSIANALEVASSISSCTLVTWSAWMVTRTVDEHVYYSKLFKIVNSKNVLCAPPESTQFVPRLTRLSAKMTRVKKKTQFSSESTQLW